MDKIREEVEKWHNEVIKKTVFSLDYEDDVKSYMFICYKSCNEEIEKLNNIITAKHDSLMIYVNRSVKYKEEVKKLKDQISKLESHMGLPDLNLKSEE